MAKEPTVQSVKDGLAKVLREVRLLTSEVEKLNSKIRTFKDSTPHIPTLEVLPPRAGGSDYVSRYGTEEPRSAIREILYEYGDTPNLEIPTKTLIAIARELDGALRDVRAARKDIEAIADDSDLRREFKNWQAH